VDHHIGPRLAEGLRNEIAVANISPAQRVIGREPRTRNILFFDSGRVVIVKVVDTEDRIASGQQRVG
jgi:hypothetical protein